MNYNIALALVSLVISTSGVLLYWEPLLTLCQPFPDHKFPILLVYAYLYMLIPLNFYLNILLVFVHDDLEVPSPVFFKQYLPRVARVVSLVTLVLSAPLYMHAAVTEESIDLAIGAALVCVALVIILSSVLKNFLVLGGFQLAFLALCISTGFFLSDDLFITFFNKDDHYNLGGHHIPIYDLALLFLSFVTFTLGITLVIWRTGKPDNQQHAVIQAESLVFAVLSVAISTLLAGWYMKVYGAFMDMGAFFVLAGKT